MADHKKDVTRLLSDLNVLGIGHERNGGSHWQLTKNGERLPGAVISSSPSDRRWYNRAISELKRLGVVEEDPRKTVQKMKTEARRNRTVQTHAPMDEDLLVARMSVRDELLKRGLPQVRVAEMMVETRGDGVPSTVESANEMIRKIMHGAGSDHALKAVVRALKEIDRREQERNPLACPECEAKGVEWIGKSPAGLGKHRYSHHGVQGTNDSALRARELAGEKLRDYAFPCPVEGCASGSDRKSGLSLHLKKMHGIDAEGRKALEEPQVFAEQMDIREEPVPTVSQEELDAHLAKKDAAYTLKPGVAQRIINDAIEATNENAMRLVRLALLIDPSHAEEAETLLAELAVQL